MKREDVLKMLKTKYASERKPEDIERMLEPLVREWFHSRFKDYSLPQLFGVMPIHERKSILISAPTGGTKTLTAFLAILNYLVSLAVRKELEDKVYAIYVSPLKALSADIHVNLIRPLEEIKKIAEKNKVEMQDIIVGLRTGDTTASERQKMYKKTPHILITTPESLAIMITTPKFVLKMRRLEYIVIDEIHALANKRGVHLSLSLERIEYHSSITPVRIGLSATVWPLEDIAQFLVGSGRECLIADVQFSKQKDIEIDSEIDIFEDEAAGVQKKVYITLNKLIQEHKTTLIFTNTRAATERVVHYLKESFPQNYASNIGAHHSSLSKEHRFEMERRLREGSLKVIVSSTSLELGIDIGCIDLVILLGSPKSVARALQRCLSYDSEVLCADGVYRKIGKIVEQKQDLEIISYNKDKGFVKNKIKELKDNGNRDLLLIELECGEEIKCTKEHPILTNNGWQKAEELKEGDLVAEIKEDIKFDINEPYLYELLPKEKIFVQNKDNFFQKIIDNYRKENRINAKNFSESFEIPYSRFIDIRRLRGRKKSIRLDYFLKACELCKIEKEKYLSYLKYLKTKGAKWPKWPLRLTKEIMWFAGVVATDGCIVKSNKKEEAEYYKLKIGNKSKVMIDKIKEIAKNIGIKPYITVKEGFYNLEFGSNLLAYIFIGLGIPCKNKSFDICVNNSVYSLSNELVYAYLEGIFEGDGNLSIPKGKNRGIIRLFSASKEFAIGLHTLLLRLGISNKVSKNKIKASKLIPKVSNNWIYCVGVYRKEDLRKFFENIQGYGEKAIRGKEATKDYAPYLSVKEGFNPFINYVKIKSITSIGNERVYNLTLNEPNNFIVGNVIVHNCGRAGHKLYETAKGRFIVLDRDDLVECAVMTKAIKENKIDRVSVPKNCLDVLSQQIIGISIEKEWGVNEIYNLVRKSYCYEDLKIEDFLDVISYLAGEYALEHRNIYAKIWYNEKERTIGRRSQGRLIYMTNVGTIPEESFLEVEIAGGEKSGRSVGKVDESFLERLKVGDVFVLGGSVYSFAYTRGMKVYVRSDVKKSPTIPSWFSEMLPLSFDLACEIQRFRKIIDEKMSNKESPNEIKEFIQSFVYCKKEIAEKIYDYFYEQYQYAEIPHIGKIIAEFYRNEKTNVVFHSLFGRKVNDVLSRVIGFLVARLGGRDIEIGISDNGFYLRGEKITKEQIDKAIKNLTGENIRNILEETLENSEILKRRFRHCAARSFMILRNYKGRKKSVGRQQMSSSFMLHSVKKMTKNFPILREAKREVMEEVMDIENAKQVVKWIKDNKIAIKYIERKIPSPFAHNLIMQGYGDLIKMESKIEFLKRLRNEILKEIGVKDEN